MNVNEIYANFYGPSGSFVEVNGWLVIIDKKLFLLEDDYPDNYWEQGKKIEIVDYRIMYSVINSILPLGGGRSSIFHKAKVLGEISLGPCFAIKAKKLFVLERGDSKMREVNIDPERIEAARIQHDDFSFDYLKELGDAP